MRMEWKTTGEKRCTECGETKALANFSFQKVGRKNGHPVSRCKPCSVIQGRNNYLRKTPAERKEMSLLRRLKALGLTRQEYSDLLEGQAGACAICGVATSLKYKGRPRRLNVDHCHQTKKVRGLLCSHCNVGLGHFRDSLPLLQAAMEYLRKHGSVWGSPLSSK